MAAAGDFVYLAHLIRGGYIQGPVLDLGSRNVQNIEWGNARRLCEQQGIAWEGADAEAGRDVTFVLDVLDREAVDAVGRMWPTVIATNLFEHVYDPIRGMENALRLVRDGGTFIVITPTIWQLHDFPGDFWRPLPDFYLEFSARSRCGLIEPHWIVGDRILPWHLVMDGTQKHTPSKWHGDVVFGRAKTHRSRVVHRLFRTSGRDMFFPYVGLGVCLRRSSCASQ